MFNCYILLIRKVYCYTTAEVENLDMYRNAYESYKSACENYGMESLNFNQFVRHLTIDQLDKFNNNIK